MKINVESPWTAKDEEYVAGTFKPLFDITGIDAKTGREETYQNASFSWTGINDDVPSWTIAGHCASHALSSIDKIEKKPTMLGVTIDMRLPNERITVDDNVALLSKISENKGESISLTFKKPSGISQTLYLDVVNSDENSPLKVVDSYTDKPFSLKSLCKLMQADKFREKTKDIELA